jgi:hypothetical protein
MHSTPNGIGGCPQALARLILFWKDAGYRFVTVGRCTWFVEFFMYLHVCILLSAKCRRKYQLLYSGCCCWCMLLLQVSQLVEQIYGMSPAAVVQKARACSSRRQPG